jgi:hypothetical protein
MRETKRVSHLLTSFFVGDRCEAVGLRPCALRSAVRLSALALASKAAFAPSVDRSWARESADSFDREGDS